MVAIARIYLLSFLLMGVVGASRADDAEKAFRMMNMSLQPAEKANFSNQAQGKYFALNYRVDTGDTEVPLGKIHDWTFQVSDLHSTPLEGVDFDFHVMMPQHGHGLQTELKIRDLGQGRYRVSGMKFTMPGWWMIEATAKKGEQEETFYFHINVLADVRHWEESEKKILESLWIGSLPKLSAKDFPTNRYALSSDAADLGKKIFFDPSLSKKGNVSCSTCHAPEKAFSANKTFPVGGIGNRKPPSLLGVGYQTWFFWDGRKDSLWSQALGPFENHLEYDQSRKALVAKVMKKYGDAYKKVFGNPPKPSGEIDRAFSNLGKAVAAFEIQLKPAPSPFDRYVEKILGRADPTHPSPDLDSCAKAGLKLFIGPKARCVSCHNGPRFENSSFHDIGLPPVMEDGRLGRVIGIKQAREDSFNCHGKYSDSPDRCEELDHASDGSRLAGAFKTPTLRNVALTAPYMHAGEFKTLDEVIEHYTQARSLGVKQDTEISPLPLTHEEKTDLVCFLKSLTSESQGFPSP